MNTHVHAQEHAHVQINIGKSGKKISFNRAVNESSGKGYDELSTMWWTYDGRDMQ